MNDDLMDLREIGIRKLIFNVTMIQSIKAN